MVYDSVLDLIGNTPIIRIDKKITGLKNIELYCKCELFNPFGSVKDRTALSMFNEAKEILKNKEIDTIIESSSGNTAKALACISNIYGYNFETVTNRIKIDETKDILKIVGSSVEELPGISECPDPNDPNDPIMYINRKISANQNKYLYTNQYINMANPKIHYNTTGKEIYEDLKNVDYFFGTLGTAGSSRGIIEYLLTKNKELKKVGIIAKDGDMLPGIRNMNEMYEVGIFEKELYDDIVSISEKDAIEYMEVLNKKVGILGGPTSGGAMASAIEYLKIEDEKLEKENLEEPKKAVFIACDRVEGYISYLKKRKPEIFTNNIITKRNAKHLTKDEVDYSKKGISSEELNLKIENNEFITIIDLRGNMAYNNFKIKNSINILDSTFEEMIENGLPFDKSMDVILVCANGSKSDIYSAFLNEKGLNVYSLTGGMQEWIEKNMPVIKGIRKLR